jgi:hypothetical protein
MNTSDLEDMLFGDFDMQVAPDDALAQDSEDELLFATSQEETTQWNVKNNSNFALPTNGTILSIQEAPQHCQMGPTRGPIHDRSIQCSYTECTMANLLQTLGDRSHRSNA